MILPNTKVSDLQLIILVVDQFYHLHAGTTCMAINRVIVLFFEHVTTYWDMEKDKMCNGKLAPKVAFWHHHPIC